MIKMLTKIKKGQQISLFSDQGSNLDLEEPQQKYEINYSCSNFLKKLNFSYNSLIFGVNNGLHSFHKCFY